MTTLSGRCLCGAVKYEADDVETSHGACHCGMCRRWSGGPLLATKVSAIRFADDSHVATYPSSNWAERGFCKTCGSNLFYRLRKGSFIHVAVGSFDDAKAFKLAHEVYVDHQPEGYAFKGDLPKMTEAEVLAKFS